MPPDERLQEKFRRIPVVCETGDKIPQPTRRSIWLTATGFGDLRRSSYPAADTIAGRNPFPSSQCVWSEWDFDIVGLQGSNRYR
jgi:hypothetical protein